MLEFNRDGIPPEIQAHPHWLVADSAGAPVRMEGVGDSKTNPEHWCDFEKAATLAEAEPNLWPYMVLTDDTPFTGIDVDFKPQKPGETVPEYVERLYRAKARLDDLRERFPDRYEEKSKSGKGFHLFVSGKFEGTGGKGRGDWSEVEIYHAGHGIAITGHVSEGCERVAGYPDEFVQQVRDEIKGSPQDSNNGDRGERPDAPVSEETSVVLDRLMAGNKLFAEFYSGKWQGKGRPSQSEGDYCMACYVVDATPNLDQQEEIFRASGLYRNEHKMNRALTAARKRPAQPVAVPDGSADSDDEDLDDGTPQPFPLDALPPVAAAMVLEVARVTTSGSVSIAGACSIAVASAALGAGLEVPTGGGRKVRGNLFMAVVAKSGTGKSESMGSFIKPLNGAEQAAISAWESKVKPKLKSGLAIAKQQVTDHLGASVASGDEEAREAAVRAHAESSAEVARIERELECGPRFVVENVTGEKLAILAQGQPGEAIASISSEARGLIAVVMGRYAAKSKGGDQHLYCAGYSGDPVKYDRVSRDSVLLKSPCFTVFWMFQPDLAETILDDAEMTESGMIPRFLIFNSEAEPRDMPEQPEPIAADVQSGWNSMITALVDNYRQMGSQPKAVEVTEGASEVMVAFSNECVRVRAGSGEYADIASFAARWAENAWRMALVLHAMHHAAEAHNQPLTSDTARSAIAIIRWFIGRQLDLLKGTRWKRVHDRLSKLLALIAQHGGQVTLRDLRRSHGFNEAEVTALATRFPQRLKIEERRNPAGGPVSRVATLIPA